MRISHLIYDPKLETGGGEAYMLDRWISSETSVRHTIGFEKNQKPDWIILHGIFKFNCVIQCLTYKLLGVQCGVFLHGGTLYAKYFSRSRLRLLYTITILTIFRLMGIKVWCTSKDEYKSVEKYYKEAKIVHFGIDKNELGKLIQLRNDPAKCNRLKRRFLIVGRVAPVKRVYEFADQFIKANLENASLTVIGPITDVKKIPNRFKKHPSIKFMGFIEHDKLLHQYINHDVYVNCSVSENYSFTTRLAALLGMKCLVTNNNPWIHYCPSDQVSNLPTHVEDWADYLQSFTPCLKSNNADGQLQMFLFAKEIPLWEEYSYHLELHGAC